MNVNIIYKFLITYLLLTINIFVTCKPSNPTSKNPEILSTIQGRWVLFQNPKQNLTIKKDTLEHYYSGNLEKKSLIQISNSVISKIFENDTIKGGKDQFFFEELNLTTKEIEFQYTIISYSKYKFVLSPLHSGEILTYNRKN